MHSKYISSHSKPTPRSSRPLNALLALALLSSLPLLSSAAKPNSQKDNGGILNGPLTDLNLGHHAEGEGNRESLRLAIEHLMATYGDRYPNGSAFLERLKQEAMEDSDCDAFKTLQREALVDANPAINFERILMVRAKKNGERHSSNWQTRVSCDKEFTEFGQDELDRAIKGLAKKDKALKKLYNQKEDAKDAYRNAEKTLKRTREYKKANRLDQQKMVRQLSEYSAGANATRALHKEAMKDPKYERAYAKLGTEQTNYEDELVVLNLRNKGQLQSILKPPTGKFIGDLDLHFDGDRLLFTSFLNKEHLSIAGPTNGKGYGVFEMLIDPKTGQAMGRPRLVSPDMGADVDCYDACYLPDNRIIFASTAAYEGVPCVGGSSYVANLFRMERDGTGIRRLTFDQDGNWHPAVMENGRVMYSRWEYTDSAHYFSRLLMTMNPDGTDQKAWYGSNSYWPNSIFFGRQIPSKPHQFLATVTGHHDVEKGGALVLFDVSQGRHEADGAVQFITGRDTEVHPLTLDKLTRAYSPMFYEPFPIDDSFYLAVKDGGIWLLDRFDNMICLQAKDHTGSYHNPLPLRQSSTPPALPDQVRPDQNEATVLINDIYAGHGLTGVPRGAVKGIRVYRYEFGPRNKGGHYSMGMEAGWDAKQVLGVAPVENDGSASFKVPANTPISMQPVDDEGRAMQLMRSWTTAMPGETLSCVGCHESQDMAPPAQRYEAMLREPSKLEPFQGPTRGFSFQREVQPIVDRYCVSCHDGKKPDGRYTVPDRVIGTGRNTGKKFAKAGIPNFSKPRDAHAQLHSYVRRNGPEGDYHLLTPLEFHASTSELIQMLDKGHHNVQLDPESWETLYTWIDLNAPYHGTWTEAGAQKDILDRRKELRQLFAGDDYDPERIVNPYERSANSILPKPYSDSRTEPLAPKVGSLPDKSDSLDLGDGVKMQMVSIPSGEFSMGANDETPVERPISRVKIDKGFQMGATEVTLAQYRQFDSGYLNGVYDMHYKDLVSRGYYMNDMNFPVIRVSWEDAMAYCEWLSEKTGRKVTLPTEAQWEWACRAGTNTSLSFGDVNTDFSKLANLADLSIQRLAVKGVDPKPIKNPDYKVDYEPKDPRSNDKTVHLAAVASYQANPWGLYDMHGNVAEWTRSAYVAYPYKDDASADKKVVRGGSWHDRPYSATAASRLGYPAWQRVYDTGFRIVVEP